MKKIRINVKATYTVGLEMGVPDDVYQALCKVYDNGGDIDPNSIETYRDKELSDAADWLADNIREKDACEWEWEIVDLSENNKTK